MTTILFICTGNTCRSPMAACLCNALLEERGLTDVQAVSAGLYAASGEPASLGAQRAMQRRGLSLARHGSRPISEMLLSSASFVVGLSGSHVAQFRMLYPDCQTPVWAFDDPPVSDPYGGDDAAYERAVMAIASQLPALLAKLRFAGGAKR